MKRWNFIAAMFGAGAVAKAQQWKECVPATTVLAPSICSDKTKPAMNNQCPVCGAMAEALTRDSWSLTRCRRCNAAFFRDGV